MTEKDESNWIHFKIHRVLAYLGFWFRLLYHILFHEFDPYADDYEGYSVKGFIICRCGFVEDLGVTYGMHCDRCYARLG